jgi:hypothetical protein
VLQGYEIKRNPIIWTEMYFKETSILTVKGKGEAIPLQAWAVSGCSRRLRLPDFKTIGT